MEERAIEIAKAISVLRGMPGYPSDQDQLGFTCLMMAKFMQTVDVHHFDPDDPEWNAKYSLGWVNPLQWTVEQVAQRCTFFPPIIKWRRIHGKYFGSLDGVRADDIEDSD